MPQDIRNILQQLHQFIQQEYKELSQDELKILEQDVIKALETPSPELPELPLKYINLHNR
jgi:phage terminase Nu1 subunit (DNA packaging protein)